MKIKPAKDKRRPGRVLRVVDPESGEVLSPDGEDKPRSVYWLRRLKCGDVVPARDPLQDESKSTGKQSSVKKDQS